MANRTYERIAPLYDLLDLPHEWAWRRRLRARLFEGVSGRILDAGIGTGRNIPFYPAGCHVVGIDNSPRMLAQARRRSRKLGRAVELHLMDLMATDFPDGTFDAVVAVLVFGILREDEQLPALRELRRICKPGGTIRLLDYALARQPVIRSVMTAVKPWSLTVFAQRFEAGTEPCVAPAGLELDDCRLAVGGMAKMLRLSPALASGQGHDFVPEGQAEPVSA